jgi:hypothetical protein
VRLWLSREGWHDRDSGHAGRGPEPARHLVHGQAARIVGGHEQALRARDEQRAVGLDRDPRRVGELVRGDQPGLLAGDRVHPTDQASHARPVQQAAVAKHEDPARGADGHRDQPAPSLASGQQATEGQDGPLAGRCRNPRHDRRIAELDEHEVAAPLGDGPRVAGQRDPGDLLAHGVVDTDDGRGVGIRAEQAEGADPVDGQAPGRAERVGQRGRVGVLLSAELERGATGLGGWGERRFGCLGLGLAAQEVAANCRGRDQAAADGSLAGGA